MSDDERVTRLVRVRSSDRDPTLVTVVLVGLVGLALLKPWGEPGTAVVAQPASTPAVGSTLAPAIAGRPTPAASAAVVLPPSGVERLCYQPTSWWVAAVVRWPGQTVQTRKSLPAVAAMNPLDPVIPFEILHSSRVQAIGYCAPASGTERPPDDATVAVWRLDRGEAVQIQPPTMPAMGGSILGRLWSPPPGPVATLPPASSGGTGASWPTGRYVVTIQGADGGYDRWFGVEVILDGRG